LIVSVAILPKVCSTNFCAIVARAYSPFSPLFRDSDHPLHKDPQNFVSLNPPSLLEFPSLRISALFRIYHDVPSPTTFRGLRGAIPRISFPSTLFSLPVIIGVDFSYPCTFGPLSSPFWKMLPPQDPLSTSHQFQPATSVQNQTVLHVPPWMACFFSLFPSCRHLLSHGLRIPFPPHHPPC